MTELVARFAWPLPMFRLPRMRRLEAPEAGENPGWSALNRPARIYVATVIVAGVAAIALSFPTTLARPGLFAALVLASCLTSLWKVTLPVPLAGGSTLSVSYAANLMALLLLGPQHAVIVAVAGTWTQCTFGMTRPYQRYRTAFSIAAEAVTMAATGLVYERLGGSHGPLDVVEIARPLVGAIAAYFALNTGLVAGAIAWSTGRSAITVWRQEFLWSGASFFVAGSAGAVGAILIDRDAQWLALLGLAPIYLTYWTYQVFVGRLDDHARHLAQVRQTERALAVEKANAEQANRLKDQFLAIVSHELRTPLNAILGWSDMLRTGSLDDTRRGRAVHAICDSARRQSELIEELLDVSRIISGKLRLERTTVDWQEIVRSALEVAQPAASARRIDLTVDTDPSVREYYGDGARLQQIVWNLLTNAVKFTPEGGVVHLRLRREERGIELLVRDSGIGMSADFLPHVFEPFRQADGSTTRRHSGLGLGLSIVKHLVEAHGGTIGVSSAGEGRGSTFTVALPSTLASRDDREREAERSGGLFSDSPASPTALSGLSVLVVDDDDDSRDVVVACLENCGAHVHRAASAAEAIDVLRAENVSVLLADIAMPGQDGYQLIRKVRSLGPTGAGAIPAAALTAFARAEDRRRALDAGFQMHLTKPIGQRALVEAVTALSRIDL